MWNTKEKESSPSNIKFTIEGESTHKKITNRHFLELLEGNKAFRIFYNSVLSNAGFDAFFWENKPMTQQTLNEVYECNLVKSDYLAGVHPDHNTFEQYFEDHKDVVVFPNLGKDAQLIAPCPRQEHNIYTHIGNFVRKADQDQLHAFWKTVGKEAAFHIGDKPRWLSTSGLGVFWLHVRIDSYPKYYQTHIYKHL
ncbi:MAG: hypothetical protein FH748_06915 [Balneolaceae bacterium]|nr:hypothetical protein [Balneolaceae bacterium]